MHCTTQLGPLLNMLATASAVVLALVLHEAAAGGGSSYSSAPHITSVNTDLTYRHTQTHLLHLMRQSDSEMTAQNANNTGDHGDAGQNASTTLSSAGEHCTLGAWIGSCPTVLHRCRSDSCHENSECSYTNNAVCDEGSRCPAGTDDNDCAVSAFTTCESMAGTSCTRCIENIALGGGWCGWNPDEEDCETARLQSSEGYDRCDPCPEKFIGNGVCDGPPGWVSPGTGICRVNTDPNVVDGHSCNGNVEGSDQSESGGFDVSSAFVIGTDGYHNIGGFSGFQVDAHAKLTMEYHLLLNFKYDDFLGIPIGVEEMEVWVGGAFEAVAGFRADGGGEFESEKMLWEGHLADVTLYIGLVPLVLNFEADLKVKAKLDLQGPSDMHADAEVRYDKSMKVGIQYNAEDGLQSITDETPLTQTVTGQSFTGGEASSSVASL